MVRTAGVVQSENNGMTRGTKAPPFLFPDNAAATPTMKRTALPNGTKRPPGRPSKYRPEMCQTVIDVMSRDSHRNLKMHVAAELGISEECFYKWIEQHEEFSDAVKIGTVFAKRWWADQVGIHIKGGFNLGGWQWIMMNCFGWTSNRSEAKEEVAVKHTGKLEQVHSQQITINVAGLPDEKLQEFMALLSQAKTAEGKTIAAEPIRDTLH